MAKAPLAKKSKKNDLSVSKRKHKKQKAQPTSKDVQKGQKLGKPQLKTKFNKSSNVKQRKGKGKRTLNKHQHWKVKGSYTGLLRDERKKDEILRKKFEVNSKNIKLMKSDSPSDSIVSDSTQLVSPANIQQAIIGIRKLATVAKKGKEKKNLLDDPSDEVETFIFLQVSLSKLPETIQDQHLVGSTNIKVKLPYSLTNDKTEVLLITRDLERGIRIDHDNSLHHYTELLQKHGAAKLVNEVIPLRQLKVEYKEFEAKRHLANRFDVVLCDDTVIRFVPKFLGKHFFSKKKIPIQVNLKSQSLHNELTRALSVSQISFSMGGNSALMKIGRLSQTDEQIAENIKATAVKLARFIPGGWKNIMNLNLKLADSISIPIYVRTGSLNAIGVINPKPIFMKEPVSGVITTASRKVVTVYPDGSITALNLRKNIHRLPEEERMERLKNKKTSNVANKVKENNERSEPESKKITNKKRKKTKKQKKSDGTMKAEKVSATELECGKESTKPLKRKKMTEKDRKLEESDEDVEEGTTEAKQKKVMTKLAKKKMAKKLNRRADVSSDEDEDDLEAQELAYLKKLSKQQEGGPAGKPAEDKEDGSDMDDDSDEAAVWNEDSDDDFMDESD